MHRSIRTALIATGAATAMVVAGCSTTVAGSPAPAGASSAASSAAPSAQATGDPVAWINGVCGSLLGFVRTVSTPPAIDSSSPQKAVKGLSTFLGTAVTAIDKANTDIKGAGPSPVEGGDKAVATITDALGKARTSFQAAKTKIDAVNPSDLSQVATAIPEALAPLQDLSTLNNTNDLQNTPELDKAAQQAPNCQALQTSGG